MIFTGKRIAAKGHDYIVSVMFLCHMVSINRIQNLRLENTFYTHSIADCLLHKSKLNPNLLYCQRNKI